MESSSLMVLISPHQFARTGLILAIFSSLFSAECFNIKTVSVYPPRP